MNPAPQHAPVHRAGLQPSDCGILKGIGCGAAVAAAAAACVLTDGLACVPALTAVAGLGCCDCLVNDTLISLCKSI